MELISCAIIPSTNQIYSGGSYWFQVIESFFVFISNLFVNFLGVGIMVFSSLIVIFVDFSDGG